MSGPSQSGHHREEARTSETDATLMSQDLPADIELVNLLSQQLDVDHNAKLLSNLDLAATTAENLRRLLSNRSKISITSSFAESQTAARFLEPIFRKIGFGQCGVILETPGSPFVTKVARTQGFVESLWQDYTTHCAIWHAFDAANKISELEVRIPKVVIYRATSSAWWDEHWDRINGLINGVRTSAIISERIMPIPKSAREWFIDMFCPEDQKATVKQDPANRDCLMRLYLGKRRHVNDPPTANFTLRNYNLTLDQMIELRLPILEYARSMGHALAVIHWGARSDGFDIEFVLGSEPAYNWFHRFKPLTVEELRKVGSPADAEKLVETVKFKKRVTRIWVLDFNLCSVMPNSAFENFPDAVLQQYVTAFFENDPYYPRPQNSDDGGLWEAFSKSYLTRGNIILGGAHQDFAEMPEKFIRLCVDHEKGASDMTAM